MISRTWPRRPAASTGRAGRRPGLERFGLEPSGPEQFGAVRPGPEQFGLERSGPEQAGAVRSGLVWSGPVRSSHWLPSGGRRLTDIPNTASRTSSVFEY
ncbi:hypothetical protein GCM10009839_74230 [Catenulispora yoronensis]|uniref:Uncharacterized protein n=1 Tax=Catenulispora yoronensis TaxID=450799 RepID=A0ABN2V922_9ACTN